MSEPPIDVLKRCARCGESKPATLDFFSRNRSRKDGLRAYCKICLRVKPEDRVRKRSETKFAAGVWKKACTQCGEWFTRTAEFFARNGSGYSSKCKECLRRNRGTVVRASRNDAVVVDGIASKACTKCEAVKPATLEYFSANKDGKLGLHPWCRKCLARYESERALRTGKVRRPQTPPKEIGGILHRKCLTCETWKPATGEFFQPQRGCALGLRPTCRECMRERSRIWAEVNSDKAIQRAREWIKANPERHKQHLRAVKNNRRAAVGSLKAADIRGRLEQQGRRCFYCGDELGADYHVDHFIALARGGTNDATNIVIACPTCNRRKGAKDPHKFLDRMRK